MNELIFRALYNLTVTQIWLKPVVILAANYLAWVTIALVLIHFVRRPDHFVLTFSWLVALGAWFVAHLIKWAWPLPRPFLALGEAAVQPLIDVGISSAFPSGHATFFFGLAIAIYFTDKKFGQWLIGSATLIGLARVMSGVHWPSDIFGGLIVALLAASSGLFIARLLKPGFGRRS